MNTEQLIDRLKGQVVPVVNITAMDKVDGICEFLIANNYQAIEITYRTDMATSAIRYVKERYNLLVGAGTVINTDLACAAIEAGADFIVAPGLNESVVRYAQENATPIIPGVETATEIEKAMSMGLYFLKFFPAELAGGVAKLKALHAPYRNIMFMPTGGITQQNLSSYMSLDCVACCGGSYIIPKELL